MKWTVYLEDFDALDKLSSSVFNVEEDEVSHYESLRHDGLCDHVYGPDYALTDAGRAVLKALYETSANWWRAGCAVVSFKDQSLDGPVVSPA